MSRKNHKRWIHSTVRKNLEFTTACGKTAYRTERTSDIEKVTCPRCLEILQEVK